MSELQEGVICYLAREYDLPHAVNTAKRFANEIGFKEVDVCMIATVTSELATNILKYATAGRVEIKKLKLGPNVGIAIIAEDEGPGIEEVDLAFSDNYSTSKTLGLGLPSVKRIMDEVTIDTDSKHGTRIIATKWIE